MQLIITLNLDNADFIDGGTMAVEQILIDLCQRLPEPLADTNGDLNLHDQNGHHCGTARITDRQPIHPRPSQLAAVSVQAPIL